MEENKEELEQINPEDIVLNDTQDEDMPEPKTDKYEQEDEVETAYVRLNFTFMNLFLQCLGKLPYAATLTNGRNESIKLIDLIKFVEVKQNKIGVNELNKILNFIGNCPLEYVRPLMEKIENKEEQQLLWEFIQ